MLRLPRPMLCILAKSVKKEQGGFMGEALRPTFY